MDDALLDSERFGLVIADPPYLVSAEVARYPDDPPTAIDGGADGLALIDRCLAIAIRHALPGAPVLVQVRGPAQAGAVADLARERARPLVLEAVRAESAERAVVLFRRDAEFLDATVG